MQFLVNHEELTDLIVFHIDDINCFLSTCRKARTQIRERMLMKTICVKYYPSMQHMPLQIIRQLPLNSVHVQSLKLHCPCLLDECRFKLSYRKKIYLVLSENRTMEIEQDGSTKIIETTANQTFNGDAIVKGVSTFADDRYLCVITFLMFDVALYMHILNLETKQWTMKYIAWAFDMLQVTSILNDNSFTMTTATVSDGTLQIESCIVDNGSVRNHNVFTMPCAGARVLQAAAYFPNVDKQVFAYTRCSKVHLLVVSNKGHDTLVELDTLNIIPAAFFLTPVLDYLVIRHASYTDAGRKSTFETLALNINTVSKCLKVSSSVSHWSSWVSYIPAVPLDDGSLVEIFLPNRDYVTLRLTRFFIIKQY